MLNWWMPLIWEIVYVNHKWRNMIDVLFLCLTLALSSHSLLSHFVCNLVLSQAVWPTDIHASKQWIFLVRRICFAKKNTFTIILSVMNVGAATSSLDSLSLFMLRFRFPLHINLVSSEWYLVPLNFTIRLVGLCYVNKSVCSFQFQRWVRFAMIFSVVTQ